MQSGLEVQCNLNNLGLDTPKTQTKLKFPPLPFLFPGASVAIYSPPPHSALFSLPDQSSACTGCESETGTLYTVSGESPWSETKERESPWGETRERELAWSELIEKELPWGETELPWGKTRERWSEPREGINLR